MKLTNKTIVVTGVSSGIGAETARTLRAHGATVIGVDRNEPSLSLDAFVQADLSHPDAIDAADQQLLARVNYLGLRHLSEAMLPRIREGGAIVNVSSVLGAKWPQRLALHRTLGAVEGFAAGEAWLRDNPVADQTC